MATKLHKAISRNIQAYLETQGKTAEKLAYEAGISKGLLSNILSLKKQPGLDTLQKLAQGLDVKVEDLVKGA
jgi:transcriptional regulator with XRE-family HTH domain